MTNPVSIIPFSRLVIAFLPVAVLIVILFSWSLNGRKAIYAVCRMLGQLLVIGYLLTSLFAADNGWIILSVLLVMLCVSSWIALGNIKEHRKKLYAKAFYAISLGGGATLFLVTQGVLDLSPWYLPRYMVPLAGMIFAASMNSVSLAADRFFAEMSRAESYEKSRSIALRAALIPNTNSLFAVGLVSLPGMMTGQILSGISPLIAARYQIMVMCMIFGAAGISAAIFLLQLKKHTMNATK